jgi:hypothetical protein
MVVFETRGSPPPPPPPSRLVTALDYVCHVKCCARMSYYSVFSRNFKWKLLYFGPSVILPA